MNMPIEELIKSILDSPYNKTTYGWNDNLETVAAISAEKQKSFWDRYWPQILSGLLLFIIGYVLFKPNRKKLRRA